ncbi:MarR family winged helix-turn-helix transcriptional regulator [Microbacterium indicum]|uniref:MarR family winged helix-turn-helix transcriptional regulator n=1 Tax=Microbacterium indicum TaxID=358100 RepID=UPI000403F6F9|nr:MarR family winged helix-turn-helix transcriptional regulator [Microbacterium indicum]
MAENAHRRRTPTEHELRIWRGYTETSSAITARLAARMQEDSGLGTGDYRVLLALSEAEGRTARSSELAALVDWERSRLSHHLGRMERRGLISRAACADDSRGAQVTMTDAGADAFRRGSVPHLRAVREVFVDALTPDQLADLGEITQALRRHLGLGEAGTP